MAESALPWVEKYRPVSLDGVEAHADVLAVLRRFVAERRLPHLLFHGPPGTGKTSTALALAAALFPASGPVAPGRLARYSPAAVLELNASDDRGIGVVREQIKTFAGTRSALFGGAAPAFKLVILDECDAMTSAAQAALRRVMERYVRNVRFVLVCNHAAAISPALQSRCMRFRFAPLLAASLRARLDAVVASEGLHVDDDARDAIVSLAHGDMRRVLNVLQAAAAAASPPGLHADAPSIPGSGRVTLDAVYATTGAPHPADVDAAFSALLGATASEDPGAAASALRAIQTGRGLAAIDVVRGLAARVQAVDMAVRARALLLRALADAEYRLAGGACAEDVQMRAVAGAFYLARDLLV